MKIKSLEAENCELKEDLKMMEQERLRSWQMQVKNKNQLVAPSNFSAFSSVSICLSSCMFVVMLLVVLFVYVACVICLCCLLLFF